MTTFCTTEPPVNGRLVPYTKEGPFCALMTSVALSLGGLVVGSTAAFMIHKAHLQWFNEVRYPSA